ncbi:uncharacterized protein LOC126988738 isoform X3 [Eriocheir sinensis]|uniref:uncharacterized protein LOC126988738 isoform X3 n=1 Tax=Eriocheir sinensis TaxID=95602 RepID=UPI0021C57051|nr:uncharacterized protein LOC126988738 isoform X3 [Eriocheir sinensis]
MRNVEVWTIPFKQQTTIRLGPATQQCGRRGSRESMAAGSEITTHPSPPVENHKKRILSNGRFSDTDRIIVSCPTGQCSCQEVLVDAQGSSCFHFDGLYKRTSRDGRNSTTDTQPTERKEKRSQCLLTELSKCLTKNQDTNTEKGCEMYTEPLMANATKPESGQEKYEMFFFEMKKLDEHDFWLIESEEKVYAVSRNIGPCPDQLTPDSNAWIRTDDNFSESINVTCVAWDSPSGD